MYDNYARFASLVAGEDLFVKHVFVIQVIRPIYKTRKLKLYKTRSQIKPPMHVIPRDMVYCQAPPLPLSMLESSALFV